MSFYVVSNSLYDALQAKLDAAFAECPDAEKDREHLYHQLLAYLDEHGVIPDFTLTKAAPAITQAAGKGGDDA